MCWWKAIRASAQSGRRIFERGQRVLPLPFAVEAAVALDVANARRVGRRKVIVEAAQPLVQVVRIRVAAALVEERDVLVALDARQRHPARVRDHLLGRPRVDALDVAQYLDVSPSVERMLSCRGEAILKGTVDVCWLNGAAREDGPADGGHAGGH